jgi:hypothetical protein
MSARRRTPATAWKPGQSGNPNGRTPGSGEVGKLRASIAKCIPEVIEKLKTAALEGDVAAARLLIERIVPPVKPTELPVPMTLPDGTLSEQGRAVLGAIGTGTLAPGQGSALLTAIGALARLVELDEIERRLAALEGRSTDARADAGSAG